MEVFAHECRCESEGRGVFVRKSGLLLIIFVLLLSQFGGFPVHAVSEDGFTYEVNGDGSTVTITGYASDASKEVEIPATLVGKTVTVIGSLAFNAVGLTSVTIPDSVTTIGDRAFQANLLSTVAIPSSITTISESAFAGNQLSAVTIPDSVTTIGGSAFANNQLLTVTIPSSITTISESAFAGNRLSAVIIPESVTTIGGSAFRNNQLSTVTIYNDGMSIGDDAFWFDTGNPGDVTLYGYGASTTEGYATSNGHLFILIGKSVTYDGNDETSGDVPIDKRTYGGDQEVTLLDNGSLQKTGHTFNGWNTSADESEVNYLVGSKYLMEEEDVTLYAKWTPQATTPTTPTTPTTHYVSENGGGNKNGRGWENAFKGLQAALNVANTGDEIRIAQGTYYPTKESTPGNSRTATFQMKNGVAIYGGFAGISNSETVASRDWETNETILSGDLGTKDDTADNAYHVFYHPVGTNLNNTAVLDGVNIVGGNANVTNSESHSYGGGMSNMESHPVLTNVTLSGNNADIGGGMSNMESHPVLTNVALSGNTATNTGGGMYNEGGHPELTNVTLGGNAATYYGGGMYNWHSHLELTNVTLSGNTAGNDGGGIYNQHSNSKLTNVTLSGNTANTGGGMYNYSSNPIIDKSIIWGNKGPIQNEGSSPTFKDSIIEGSGGSDGWNTSFGVDGDGNLDVDPLFVDPKNFGDAPTLEGDYRLLPNSPAIMISGILMGALGVYESAGVPETKHTLIFEVDGVEVGRKEVVEDEKATQPTPPTKAEHTFVGWYKDVALEDEDEDEWNFAIDVVTEDTILYAKWTPFTYTENPDSVSVTIIGYASTAAKDVVIPGNLGGKIVTMIGAETFHPDTSAFYDKGLTSVEIPDSVKVIGNNAFSKNKLTDVKIPSSVTSIGTTAFGHNDLTSVEIPNGVVSIGHTAFSGNDLTSVDVPNSVKTIGMYAFQGNQLTSLNIPASVTSIGEGVFTFNDLKKVTFEGEVLSIIQTPFSHQNGFLGWYINEDFITAWDNTVPRPMTIYAKYAYKVSFDTGGGSAIAKQEIAPNRMVTVPVTPTRTGHTFAGWYKEAGFVNKWNFATDIVTADTVLYAKWTSNPSGGGAVQTYTLIFDTNGGSVVATQNLIYNEKAVNPTAPTKAGHTLAGWYKEATFTNEWNFTTDVVKENTTLYAKWTTNSPSGGGGGGSYYNDYTFTFNTNEGSTVVSQTLEYNEKAVNPTAPTKTGYTFVGWYKEATFTNEWDFAIDVVRENTTLYAKWMENPTSGESPAPIPVQPTKPICTTSFPDIVTHWAQKEIENIACQGIIIGYPDGTFKPNKSITREHVALMFTRAFELTPIRSSVKFTDVPTSHRYYDAITLVYQAGIFDGAPNSNFNPDTDMTRAQMAKVLVLAFELESSETSANIFRDVPETHWAKDYIAILADNGIALGDNGNFKPEESVTRAQFVAFMYRALNL